jgi:putative DNA methylase
MEYKKKLIEVALPLEAINTECIREKSIRHGNISTIHRYWARRPLASARALILGTLIDDPSNDTSLTEEEVNNERQKIFNLIASFIKWENRNNPELYSQVYEILNNNVNINEICILDPFCGGGSIPYEAQSLGIKSYASDLNPLAVILNKSIIEIPFKYINQGSISHKSLIEDSSSGLLLDFEYYGHMLIENTKNDLIEYYPKYNSEDIIGWIWAKYINCLNPNCMKETPLLKSYKICSNKKHHVALKPIIKDGRIRFEITNDKSIDTKGNVSRTSITCLHCNSPFNLKVLKKEVNIANSIEKPVCIITEGNGRRNYYDVPLNYLSDFSEINSPWQIDVPIPKKALGINIHGYGFTNHSLLYNARQMKVLTSLCDNLVQIKKIIQKDAEGNVSGNEDEYVGSILTYLSFMIDKIANQNCRLTRWNNVGENIEGVFVMQSLEMKWEYVESNPFSNSTGNILGALKWISNVIKRFNPKISGFALQKDVKSGLIIDNAIIITDPPYYDNVGYADLTDFFYGWLKKNLNSVYPDILSTIATPKSDELIANPYIYNNDRKLANDHFFNGMMEAAQNIFSNSNEEFPVVYYYAFKQTESSDSGISSTGWETFLEGLLHVGYQITATWPIRTERLNRTRALKANALASSIAVVLRKRKDNSIIATRKEFVDRLSNELEIAINKMMNSDISPVDLQQSSIGPGMAIFSLYEKVLEADGSAMTVRTALQLINAELDHIQENSDIEMDSDTRFCIQWFDSYGFDEQPYGEAETLAKAKDISVDGLVNAGVFLAHSGKAKLKHWSEMPSSWDPREDNRLTLWECTHHMVRELIDGDGQLGAAKLAKFMGSQRADESKELAYQLYHICDKRSWAKHAGDYNTLVSNWADIKSQIPNVNEGQKTLF